MKNLIKILNSKENDPKHKIARQINAVGVLGFLLLSSYSLIYNIDYKTFLFCFFLCLFSYIFLIISKKHNLVYWILSAGSTIAIQYSTIVLNNSSVTHYPDFIWIIPCILIAFYGLGAKVGILFFIINFSGLCYFTLFKMNDHITEIKPQTLSKKISLIIEVFICLILIANFVRYYIKENTYHLNKLKKLNVQLESQNELIINQNDEKTILIKEIHHRVKNNLQIIVSLLRLQLNNEQINNDEVLIKITNRVHSMSLVHQKLYQKEDLSSLNLNDYIIDLFEHIKHIFEIDKNIILNLESSIDNINYENMIPIGLILNELMSNSFKYAFKDNNILRIIITQKGNNKISIKYDDLSSYNILLVDSPGFGIDLIKSLVEQLNGEISQNKTTKEIIF